MDAIDPMEPTAVLYALHEDTGYVKRCRMRRIRLSEHNFRSLPYGLLRGHWTGFAQTRLPRPSSNFSVALFLMRAVESAPKCLSLFQRWHFRLCHPLSVLS